MKLWQKNYNVNKEIEAFTVGNDHLLDKKLVKYDCLASIAHAKMLGNVDILKKQEVIKLVNALNQIIVLHDKNKFNIKQEDEDCHTAIENFLVDKLGNVGKKIHTARSRNDQVLVALRMYEKHELVETKKLLNVLKNALIGIIKKHGHVQIPGYTHMQKAMPSSIKMLLGSFVYAIEDDIQQLDAVFKLINQSPLGSAAGFGVPIFDIDKKMTAKELGFSKVMQNPMYCQMSRGKFESSVINVMTQVMATLNKLATDMIMFSMKEFGFISLPKEFCTGSSIMPQKKNPDVLELVRAKYSVVLGEEFKVKNMISNLISGYNRDMQLTKEPLMNSIEITKQCIKMMSLLISETIVSEENKTNCKKAMTPELYATEEAYKLVKKGISFREAYKKVGEKY